MWSLAKMFENFHSARPCFCCRPTCCQINILQSLLSFFFPLLWPLQKITTITVTVNRLCVFCVTRVCPSMDPRPNTDTHTHINRRPVVSVVTDPPSNCILCCSWDFLKQRSLKQPFILMIWNFIWYKENKCWKNSWDHCLNWKIQFYATS